MDRCLTNEDLRPINSVLRSTPAIPYDHFEGWTICFSGFGPLEYSIPPGNLLAGAAFATKRGQCFLYRCWTGGEPVQLVTFPIPGNTDYTFRGVPIDFRQFASEGLLPFLIERQAAVDRLKAFIVSNRAQETSADYIE